MRLFDAYYVFHLDGGDRGESPRIAAHYSYPPPRSSTAAAAGAGVGADAAAAAARDGGIPFTQEHVAPFCFASERWFSSSVPPKQRGSNESFVFVLTLEQGDRIHGFCQRNLRLGEEHDRVDLVPRGWEAACFVTRVPGFRIFNDLLSCVRVRRAISMSAAEDLLTALYNCDISALSGPAPLLLRIQSPIQHVACEYIFPLPRTYDIQDFPLFTMLMTPHMLHYALGALLLERRIIVIGRHESELSAVIHGLVSLIRPFKYPHIFVPIIPHHLLAYIGAPSPYLVGVLGSQVDSVNSIKDLGDVVFVDLIARSTRLAPNSADLQPFGYVSQSVVAPGSTARNSTDEDRPWVDVCNPFMKSVISAFKSNNANELRAAVLACIICLLLKDSRGNFSVEDPQLRSFFVPFRSTQVFLMALASNSEGQQQSGDIGDPEFEAIRIRIMSKLSRGGFTDVRQAIGSVAIDVTQPAPSSITDPTVLDVTSNSPPKSTERDPYNNIAKRSFDANACVAIMNSIWARYNDSAGRNWKHGLKAMKLLLFLLSAGSEIVVASVWNNIGQIHALTRFSTDAVGVTSRSVAKVRESAMLVYLRAVCLRELRWVRSIEGHEIIRGFKKSKTDEAVPRVPRFEGHAKSFFAELHSRTCEPPFFTVPRKPWTNEMFDLARSARNSSLSHEAPKKQPLPIPKTDLLLDFSAPLTDAASNEPPVIDFFTYLSGPEQQQQQQQQQSPRRPPPTLPPTIETPSLDIFEENNNNNNAFSSSSPMMQQQQQQLFNLDSVQQQPSQLPHRPPPMPPMMQQQQQEQQQQSDTVQQLPPLPQRPPPTFTSNTNHQSDTQIGTAILHTASSASSGSIRSDSPSTYLNEIFSPDSSIVSSPGIGDFPSKSAPPAQDLAQFDSFLQELGISATNSNSSSSSAGFDTTSSAALGNVNHGFTQMSISASSQTNIAGLGSETDDTCSPAPGMTKKRPPPPPPPT